MKPAAILEIILILAVTSATAAGEASPVAELIRDLQSDQHETRRAAWNRAASMGPDVIPALVQLMSSENKNTALAAQTALRKLCHASAAPGNEALRPKVSASLVSVLQSPAVSLPVRREACDILGSIGAEEAGGVLGGLLSDEALREDARRALLRLPPAIAGPPLAAALEKARGEFRVALAAACGLVRAESAVPALRAIADDEGAGAEARAEAARSLIRIGDAGSRDSLLRVIAAVDARRQRMLGDEVLRLGDRRRAAGDEEAARGIYRLVLENARDPALRYASLHALATAPDTLLVPVLIRALADESLLVREFAGVLLSRRDSADVSQMLQGRLREASGAEKAAIIRSLAERGAEGVAAEIEEALRSEDLDVRVTALDLAGKLADLSNAELLVEAARKGCAPVRLAALRAYLDLADAEAREDAEVAAGMLEKALALAGDEGEGTAQQRALLALAATGSARAASKIEAALRDPARKALGREAQVRYASAIGAAGRKEEAIEMLTSILSGDAPRSTISSAVVALEALGADPTIFQKKQGFVAAWKIVGPFPNEGNSAWTTAYFPETRVELDGVQTEEIDGRERKFLWRDHRTTHLEGLIDLNALMRRTENVCAYAWTELESSTDREMLLKIGSDDGIVVWVNGEKVHANNATRPCAVDQDQARARLRSGKNTILAKILQSGGDWAFCLRIAEPDGKPLDLTQLAK